MTAHDLHLPVLPAWPVTRLRALLPATVGLRSTSAPWSPSPGWEQLPPIKDMARIQFGQSRVQIEGTQVPVADFNLGGQEWISLSHHVLLWADASGAVDQPCRWRVDGIGCSPVCRW